MPPWLPPATSPLSFVVEPDAPPAQRLLIQPVLPGECRVAQAALPPSLDPLRPRLPHRLVIHERRATRASPRVRNAIGRTDTLRRWSTSTRRRAIISPRREPASPPRSTMTCCRGPSSKPRSRGERIRTRKLRRRLSKLSERDRPHRRSAPPVLPVLIIFAAGSVRAPGRIDVSRPRKKASEGARIERSDALFVAGEYPSILTTPAAHVP